MLSRHWPMGTARSILYRFPRSLMPCMHYERVMGLFSGIQIFPMHNKYLKDVSNLSNHQGSIYTPCEADRYIGRRTSTKMRNASSGGPIVVRQIKPIQPPKD